MDNLPESQDVADPELPQVTATSWLLDGHLRAYTDDLARRLRGQPNAPLLHFADSQVVTMLSSVDPDQQARARRLLVGDDVPPIVFLPINQPNAHWSLLVVDGRNSDAVATYHYDSMAQKQPQQRYLADMAAYHLGLDYEETHEMHRDTAGLLFLRRSCADRDRDAGSQGDRRHLRLRGRQGLERHRTRPRPDQGSSCPSGASSSRKQRQVSFRTPIEHKKKKSKWWKF